MTTDTIPTMIASITILPPFCLSLAQVSEKSSGDGFVFRIEVSRDGDELPSFVDAVDVCATVAKLIADGDYADVGLHGIGEVGWFCESELLNHFLNGHSLREWDGLRGRDGLPVEIEKNGAEFDFLGIGAIVFSARVCPRSFCLHCLTPFDSGSSIAQIVGKSTVKDSIEITSDQFWTICCPVCIGIVTKLNSIFGIDFVIPPKDAIDNDFDEPNRHRLSLAQIVWEVKSYLREKITLMSGRFGAKRKTPRSKLRGLWLWRSQDATEVRLHLQLSNPKLEWPAASIFGHTTGPFHRLSRPFESVHPFSFRMRQTSVSCFSCLCHSSIV